MSNPPIIRLVVPGRLRYRDVAVRTVSEVCKLVGERGTVDGHSAQPGDAIDLRDRFDAEMVSAFSEIFNNIVIHAYERKGLGAIEMTLMPTRDSITIEIRDTGLSFDLAAVPAPELETLPESGMGIHIAKALVDVVVYEAGPPNVWRLTKHLRSAGDHTHTPKGSAVTS